MLSALIRTELSYPALPLAGQLVHQRFVQAGPLVLGPTLLKLQRPRQIWTNLSHACFHILLCALDCIFRLIIVVPRRPKASLGITLLSELTCSLYGLSTH